MLHPDWPEGLPRERCMARPGIILYGYDADEGKRLWMQTRAALRAKYPGAQCEVCFLYTSNAVGGAAALHNGQASLPHGALHLVFGCQQHGTDEGEIPLGEVGHW